MKHPIVIARSRLATLVVLPSGRFALTIDRTTVELTREEVERLVGFFEVVAAKMDEIPS
jgi:hypothetical protein